VSAQSKSAEVIYPEDCADVSGMIAAERLQEEGWRARLSRGLGSLERGAPMVRLKGSVDYEEIWTAQGALQLNGMLMRWLERGRPVSLGALWERHSKLRPYLRSRTEFVLQRKREELEYLHRSGQDSAAHGLANDIARLERELSELPAPEGE